MEGGGPGRFTLNRSLCAMCGPLGRVLARVTEKVLTEAGFDEKIVSQGRKVAGFAGAWVLAAAGAPEAALAIASSTSAANTDRPITISRGDKPASDETE